MQLHIHLRGSLLAAIMITGWGRMNGLLVARAAAFEGLVHQSGWTIGQERCGGHGLFFGVSLGLSR